MAKKTAKKRNPQDVTVRNVRAALVRDQMLAKRVKALESDLSSLEPLVQSLLVDVAELMRREGIAALQVAALQAR